MGFVLWFFKGFFMRRFVLFLSLCLSLEALCKGKFDVAPSWMRIDVLEFGKTVRKIDTAGARVQLDYFLWKNVLVKSSILAGRGDANFEQYALGLAACFPFKEVFYFTPHGGYTYMNFRTTFDLPQFYLSHIKQHFTSNGPYLGIEAQWCITDKFRVGAGFVYTWSTIRNEIKPLPRVKSSSKGPSYSLLIERDIDSKWSINVGLGYNLSLDNKKHGLRGKGIKVGITRWL